MGLQDPLFNHASRGGLLEDSNELWLRGFAYTIDNYRALVVELRAMLIELNLAWISGELRNLVEDGHIFKDFE